MEAVLPVLLQALCDAPSAVLVAPPGAGKTTLVPPALLAAPWLNGRRILLLLPRRLAARAAAERIAELLGEPPGQRVGYRTRLESKIGPNARIECLTYGIFVNRIIADPELADTGALLFDEIHERSLDADLGLALALDARGGLRPDLRILAMSATLDGARFSALLDSAPVIRSEGRQFPLRISHVGRPSGTIRLETAMARTIESAMRGHEGSLLAFLPGVAEIERTADALVLPADIAIHRLHGNADPAAQRAAIAPGPSHTIASGSGREIASGSGRKCVLATSIAETSLTIDGVCMVVDSGLARRPRFDAGSGFTRLATVRVSAAAAAQRAGRAGRQSPGQVWRLWDEAETAGLLPFDPPELAEADLMPLALRLAAWGVSDPASLRWLDPPPAGPFAAARAALTSMGALSPDGRLTPHGARLQRIPINPPLAHMLATAADIGAADLAATIAVLLEERGLGGASPDLDERLARFARERGGRADSARKLASRWASLARAHAAPPAASSAARPSAALLLAHAFPDRLARRRRAAGQSNQTAAYLMAGGKGALVPSTEPLARAEWLVMADAGGAGPDARVRLAAALPEDDLANWCALHADSMDRFGIDDATGRVTAERITRLGAITIARQRGPAPARAAITAALLAEVARAGLASLPWSETATAQRARLAFAHAHAMPGAPPVDDAWLLAHADQWLTPRLAVADRLADVRLDHALTDLLDWQARARLDSFAPERLTTPAGTSHAIDYAASAGPTAETRVQALFGLSQHPMLADGRVPLLLALTSPAGRQIAITRDLPGFWRTGWRDVQKEMKGRYPRHPWPDDPASAAATVRTKAADARRRS